MSSPATTRSATPALAWRTQPWAARAVPWLVLGVLGLSAMGLYVFRQLMIAGTLHPPLDDAWIHFRFAENVARGYGVSYNPGVLTPGTTSPLWVLVLAVAYQATGNFVITSKVLGGLAYLASVAGIFALSSIIRPNRGLALLCAVFAALSGRFIWAALSGMETTLFTALTIWAIFLHLLYRDAATWRQYLPTLLFGLAAVTRPEGIALFGLAMLDRLVAVNALPASGRSVVSITADEPAARGFSLMLRPPRAAQAVLHLVLVAVLVGPVIAFNQITAGSPFPNTFAGQSFSQGGSAPATAGLLPDLDYLREAARSFLRDNFLLMCFVPMGVVALAWELYGRRTGARRSLLPLAWTLGLPVLDAFIAPNLRHHERYLMPLIPLMALVGVYGLARVAWLIPGHRINLTIAGRRVVRVGVLTLLMVATLGVAVKEVNSWSVQYGRDVRNIDEINVALGQWLRDHTEPDAVIATHDIGAIIFFSNRTVIDTVGLVEPAILPYIKRAGDAGVEEYLRARKPPYFVSWRNWYPSITDNTRDCRQIYSVIARQANPRSLLPGSEMAVYRCTWGE
jgi:arabinofuranosyltransferase